MNATAETETTEVAPATVSNTTPSATVKAVVKKASSSPPKPAAKAKTSAAPAKKAKEEMKISPVVEADPNEGAVYDGDDGTADFSGATSQVDLVVVLRSPVAKTDTQYTQFLNVKQPFSLQNNGIIRSVIADLKNQVDDLHDSTVKFFGNGDADQVEQYLLKNYRAMLMKMPSRVAAKLAKDLVPPASEDEADETEALSAEEHLRNILQGEFGFNIDLALVKDDDNLDEMNATITLGFDVQGFSYTKNPEKAFITVEKMFENLADLDTFRSVTLIWSLSPQALTNVEDLTTRSLFAHVTADINYIPTCLSKLIGANVDWEQDDLLLQEVPELLQVNAQKFLDIALEAAATTGDNLLFAQQFKTEEEAETE